jgi:hypothetical protein
VYQGQKVHLFRPILSFLAEARPRLQIGEDKRHSLPIIDFVGFVANLLKRPIGAQGQRSKKSYFSSARKYVKLPFSLRVPKKYISLGTLKKTY